MKTDLSPSVKKITALETGLRCEGVRMMCEMNAGTDTTAVVECSDDNTCDAFYQYGYFSFVSQPES
jgi:hypothetical protein